MSTKKEIAIKDETQKKVDNAVSVANSMVVETNQGNVKATGFLKMNKEAQKMVSEELDPGIKKANELHKHLTGQKKRILGPLQEAERVIKGKIGAFLDKMEKERLEEQRKAREKAEAEERRIREAKEKQQREWEAKEKAKREEAERLEAEGKAEEARKAREAADKAAEKAEEREQQAAEAFVPAPIVENKVETQKGVSRTKTWKFEVTDEMKIPREYLTVDEKGIGQVVRATQGRVTIPGVRIYADTGVSVRTGA